MKRSLLISAIGIAVAIVILAGVVIASMIKKPSIVSASLEARPLILVSVEPYAEMVKQVGGNTVQAISVIPAHVDPHNWEPTYQDMNRLKNAKVWFTVGMGFENSLQKRLLEVNPQLTILNLNDGIDAISSEESHSHDADHPHEEIDTHTWLAPTISIDQAQIIAGVLSQLLPQNIELYQENFKKLEKRLITLNDDVARELKPYKGKILVTTHGAYTYYCRAYGLQQLVIEPSSGKEPRMREITELVKKLKAEKEDVIGIFTQPQHTNKAANILAEALGMETHMVDPLAPNYIQTIQHLTNIIVESRKGD